MIKKSDLISLSDKTKNTINMALGFLTFMRKEDAENYKDILRTLRAEFTSELSIKNVEYEAIAKKALRVVRNEYIPRIEEYGKRTPSLSVANTKDAISQLSDNFIESTKNIIHVDDKSFSVSNIMPKIASYNIKSQYLDYIRYTADAVLRLQELCTKHEECKFPNDTELKSNFDTFCVKTQNVLFHKYLDILLVLDKIEYTTQFIDALTILSIVISQKKLFSNEKILAFLDNKPFDGIINVLMGCDYID